MNPNEDAHGNAMWDRFVGGKQNHVIERDDGFLVVMDTGSFFQEYDEWNYLHKKAMQYVKGRILDLGCGAGRHSLYLQNKGYDVTGIDNSPLAIKVCRSRGLEKVLVGDIENLDFPPASFDTFLIMGNGLGLLGSPQGGRRLLKKWYPLLSKDGIIVPEGNDPYKTADPLNLAYQKRNRERGRMAGQIRVRIRYKQYKTKWFDILLASRKVVQKLVRESGWRVRQFLDGKDSYYIVIIEKTNS